MKPNYNKGKLLLILNNSNNLLLFPFHHQTLSPCSFRYNISDSSAHLFLKFPCEKNWFLQCPCEKNLIFAMPIWKELIFFYWPNVNFCYLLDNLSKVQICSYNWGLWIMWVITWNWGRDEMGFTCWRHEGGLWDFCKIDEGYGFLYSSQFWLLLLLVPEVE